MAVNALDDDEKNTIVLTEGIRGNPAKVIVNESGLYCLIIRSDKPQAKLFKRWVTHEVLPSILKTGSCSRQPMVDRKGGLGSPEVRESG